jgi:hypothetical protein
LIIVSIALMVLLDQAQGLKQGAHELCINALPLMGGLGCHRAFFFT